MIIYGVSDEVVGVDRRRDGVTGSCELTLLITVLSSSVQRQED